MTHCRACANSRSRAIPRSSVSRACRRSTGCAAATSLSPTAASVAGALARMDSHRSPWDGLPDEQILLRPGTRPLHAADGRRLPEAHGAGRQPAACRPCQRCRHGAAQDAGAWSGCRPREFAAHVPSAAAADHQQHRERHALGALRRARPQHLAATRTAGARFPARACRKRRLWQRRGRAALRSRLRRARQHGGRRQEWRGALPGLAAHAAPRRVPLVHAHASPRGQHRAGRQAAAVAARHALHRARAAASRRSTACSKTPRHAGRWRRSCSRRRPISGPPCLQAPCAPKPPPPGVSI